MAIALAVLAAYLLGSISFAVVVSKLMGLPDPRTYGSKNPGATNVLRTGRTAAAVLTLAGDAAKGWLAAWLAGRYLPDAMALAGLAAFLGHLYPVYAVRRVLLVLAVRPDAHSGGGAGHGRPARLAPPREHPPARRRHRVAAGAEKR
jgi:hypothetical protein